jgi:hypothetical protein
MIPKNRRDDDDHDNDSGDIRADSDFLAYDDRAIRDFRESEKESKKTIVKHMVKLRHNLQYNKHLLSVYLKAKTIFDEMVDEHRTQIHHLDEIYKHLSKLINEQLTKKNKPSKKLRRGDRDIDHDKPMLKELVKDKKNIGKLLSNMRKGLDKLMEIDTIIGTTIDKINEIQFIEDNDEKDEKDEGDEGDIEDDEDSASEEEDEDEDSASEEEDDADEDEDSASEEEDDDESASEQEEDEDSASEEEDDADEEEDDADEQEDDADEEEDEDEDEDSTSDEEDSTSEDDDREPIVFY